MCMLTHVSRWIVAGLILLLPLFFIPANNVFFLSKPILLLLSTFLLTVCLVILDLKRGSLAVPKTYVFLSLLLLGFVSVVSALFVSLRISSVIDVTTLESALYFLCGIILVYGASRLITSLKYARMLILSTWIAGAVLFLFHIIRLGSNGAYLNLGFFGAASSSPYGAWNDLGLFIGFCLVLALAWHQFLAKKRFWKGISVGVVVASVLFLTIIGFSIVWWIVGAAALLIFVYSFSAATRQVSKEQRDALAQVEHEGVIESAEESSVRSQLAHDPKALLARIPTLPLVLVLVSFAFILISGRTSVFSLLSEIPGLGVLNRFNVVNVEARPSPLTTVEIGWNVLKQGNVMGVGPGNFQVAWNQFKPQEVNSTILWSTDFANGYSTFLTSFVTLGILGVLGWAALILSTLMLIGRMLLGNKGEEHERAHGAVISFGVLYLLSLIVFYNPSITLLVTLFIFLGTLIALAAHMGLVRIRAYSYLSDPRIAFASVFGLVAVLLGVITLGYFTISQMYAQYAANRGAVALAAGNVNEAAQRYNQALQFDERDVYYRQLIQVALSRLNTFVQNSQNAGEEQSQAIQEQLQALVGDTIAIARRAVALDETSYTNWIALGDTYSVLTLYRVEGAYDEAVRAYERALALSPSNPLIKLAYAQLERNSGNVQKAFEYIDQAVAMKPDYTDAYFLRAQIHIQEDSLKEAIQAAELGALTAQNNPDVFLQLGILKYNDEDWNGAARAFEQALILNPQYANAQYFLALTYQKLGRTEEVKILADVLNQTNPENEQVKALVASVGTTSRAVQAPTPSATSTATTTRSEN